MRKSEFVHRAAIAVLRDDLADEMTTPNLVRTVAQINAFESARRAALANVAAYADEVAAVAPFDSEGTFHDGFSITNFQDADPEQITRIFREDLAKTGAGMKRGG